MSVVPRPVRPGDDGWRLVEVRELVGRDVDQCAVSLDPCVSSAALVDSHPVVPVSESTVA